MVNKNTRGTEMKTLTDLKQICSRSQRTLVPDALGVTALGIMLIFALHLPSLI